MDVANATTGLNVNERIRYRLRRSNEGNSRRVDILSIELGPAVFVVAIVNSKTAGLEAIAVNDDSLARVDDFGGDTGNTGNDVHAGAGVFFN